MMWLAWLILAALIISALVVIAEEMVRDAVDHALYAAQPTQADSDAAWDREIDEAIALTETPLFRWLASENPGAIDSLAAAEASRADWSEPMRWAK